MDVKDVKNILVIGAGAMGNGIAQVCAQSGFSVVMSDTSEDVLSKAMENINWSVSKFAEKGKISESAETVIGRISTSTDYDAAADADLIIEAVFEDVKVKHDVLKKIDPLIQERTIITSNTSVIPITEIASVSSRPENIIGTHFFNPVPMMNAVEVVKGYSTSDETFQFGGDFIRFLGKEPIMVKRDIPGFVLNRINMVATMEAYRLVEDGVATPDDIDKGFRLGFGRPMGPCETTDMTGLDLQLMAFRKVYEEEKKERFHPPGILKHKVLAGHWGRKSGHGWYEYNPDGTKIK